jgi:hypothetical protein
MITGTVLVPTPEWQRAVQEKNQRGELKRCRWRGCDRMAHFRLDRRHRRGKANWWHYCDEHTYSHIWLEDGMYFPLRLEDTGWAAQVAG